MRPAGTWQNDSIWHSDVFFSLPMSPLGMWLHVCCHLRILSVKINMVIAFGKTAHVAWMVVYRLHNLLTVAQWYKKVPLDTNGCNFHHLPTHFSTFSSRFLLGFSKLLISVMVLKHKSDKCQSLRTSYWNVWSEKWFCCLSQVLAGSNATSD